MMQMHQHGRSHVITDSTESTSSFPHPIHMLDQNTPRPQYDIAHSGALQAAFESSSTTVLPMDMRYAAALAIDNNMDHIMGLEKSICSDFVCCGLHLLDFHALLDHFEETHVVPLAANGKRVYPAEGLRSLPLPDAVSTCSTPTLSRSSSATPSLPSSPVSPSPSTLWPSGTGPCASRKSSTGVAPVYTPFTPSLPVDPAYPYQDSSEIIMAHESDPIYDFHPADMYASAFSPKSPMSSTSTYDEDEDEVMSDASDSIYVPPMHSLLPPISGPGVPSKHVSFAPQLMSVNSSSSVAEGSSSNQVTVKNAVKSLNIAVAVASSSSKASKAKSRSPSASAPTKAKRDKRYSCPTPRCTKSYLNPNGLKYHMEKGTCNFDKPLSDDSEPLAALTPPPQSKYRAMTRIPPILPKPTSNADGVDAEVEEDEEHVEGEPTASGAAPTTSTPTYTSTHPVASSIPASQKINIISPASAPGDAQGPPVHSFSVPASAAQQPKTLQFHYPVPSYPHGPTTLLAGYLPPATAYRRNVYMGVHNAGATQ